jgi:1-acyl-sn-glycerol-3-phosphate acyltransferase
MENIYTYVQYLAWFIVRFIVNFFLNLRIIGLENVKNLKKTGVIFVANHASAFDPFIIGCSLPLCHFSEFRRLRFVTHIEQINKWYSPIIRLLGAFPIYRKNGDLSASLKQAIEIVNSGQSLVVFPEGQRSSSCNPENARPGVAFIAKELNPTLIPVYIHNTHCIKTWEFFLLHRQASIIFGEPFFYKDIESNAEDLRKLASGIMRKICQLSKE